MAAAGIRRLEPILTYCFKDNFKGLKGNEDCLSNTWVLETFPKGGCSMRITAVTRSVLWLSIVWLAGILTTGRSTAGTIQPGLDLFETVPGQTQFLFPPGNPIPPGFFGMGSDPFTGTIPLQGLPLGT